jgi:hypothetical protein
MDYNLTWAQNNCGNMAPSVTYDWEETLEIRAANKANVLVRYDRNRCVSSILYIS